MMKKSSKTTRKATTTLAVFAAEARAVMALPVAARVNELGGYGPGGEAIYTAPPAGCPSVLVDSRGGATATFMSNGSTAFMVKLPDGMEIEVLGGSFDTVEKHEIGVPSQNLWLDLGDGRATRLVSLVNPALEVNCPAASWRVVKMGDPGRALWTCARFAPVRGQAVESAVKLSLVPTPQGPAILRQVCLRNAGRSRLRAKLWTLLNLHGTQLFVYNKEIWYDCGLPLDPCEAVSSCTVPYSEVLQVKRVSTRVSAGLRPVEATCDYLTFVGDTAATALLPAAVRRGALLATGAGARFNRFSTPTIHAARFDVSLAPGATAVLDQSLLYVTDPAVLAAFRRRSAAPEPAYTAIAKAYRAAARELVRRTPDAARVADVAAAAAATAAAAGEAAPVCFHLDLPQQPAVANYANSVWTTVAELYENCRAHGARLGNGIELGTRDRAQDMWPKMKEDPGRVRHDLVHAMSFMYRTPHEPFENGRRLTLRQKLHGMFPRQYPSRWDDRGAAVANDNRPYADSPLWLLDAITRYIRETGDYSLLAETVRTIQLVDPDRPEKSAIRGHDEALGILQVVLEVLACFERHCADSPYGMAQILYGDWCDPIDMFGTGVVGDATTRGQGRGVSTRLSAHVFLTIIDWIDVLSTENARPLLAATCDLDSALRLLRSFADRLRQAIVRWSWEEGGGGVSPGFVDAMHELRLDGTVPDYAHGETGYALGSGNKKREFDGRSRRVLSSMAYGLAMLTVDRDYLSPVPRREEKIAGLLRTVGTTCYDARLGLKLFSRPIANDEQSRRVVGRMGVLPPGCAENGEYHHGQAMMHLYRLLVRGEEDRVWEQFRPMMSASRDATLNGPFETPATSYASDAADPHFGAGMYFGLSGSVDWLVEIFQRVAGVVLNLHNRALPAIEVTPQLPSVLGGRLSYRRMVHRWLGAGKYQHVPLAVTMRPAGKGEAPGVIVNGRRAECATVASLEGLKAVRIEIVSRA